MIYLLVLLILFAFEFLYLRVASKSDALIEPLWKETTAGNREWPTLRGGGIIFWFASLLLLLFNPTEFNIWFFVAITAVAAISFWNDLRNSQTWAQLIFHLAAISIAFYITGVFGVITWWNLFFAYLLFVGVIYAFKYMDDVNGMTGLYTLAVLLPLVYVNRYIESFVHVDYLRFPFLAAIIFLIFNYRKRPATTPGDVGSMSIGFWVSFLLLVLIVRTETLVWISFVLVYVVDVLFTLGQRIYQRKALFGPEKLHFYQILGNEMKVDHRLVSLIYLLAQLVCSAVTIVLYPSLGVYIFWILFVVLIALYTLKYRLVKVVNRLPS